MFVPTIPWICYRYRLFILNVMFYSVIKYLQFLAGIRWIGFEKQVFTPSQIWSNTMWAGTKQVYPKYCDLWPEVPFWCIVLKSISTKGMWRVPFKDIFFSRIKWGGLDDNLVTCIDAPGNTDSSQTAIILLSVWDRKWSNKVRLFYYIPFKIFFFSFFLITNCDQ